MSFRADSMHSTHPSPEKGRWKFALRQPTCSLASHFLHFFSPTVSTNLIITHNAHLMKFKPPKWSDNNWSSLRWPFKQKFLFFSSRAMESYTLPKAYTATTPPSPKWHLHSLNKSDSTTETTQQPTTAQAQKQFKKQSTETTVKRAQVWRIKKKNHAGEGNFSHKWQCSPLQPLVP